MFAITHKDCPKIVDAIVTEGMFPNFADSIKNHLIERKKPVFLFLGCIDAWMKKYTGHSMKVGPINVIDRLEKPLLMLHSRLDTYSTPEYAQKLYDKAGAKKNAWCGLIKENIRWCASITLNSMMKQSLIFYLN